MNKEYQSDNTLVDTYSGGSPSSELLSKSWCIGEGPFSYPFVVIEELLRDIMIFYDGGFDSFMLQVHLYQWSHFR